MSSENTSDNRTLDEFTADDVPSEAQGSTTAESGDSSPDDSSQGTPSPSSVKIDSQQPTYQTGHPLSDEYLNTVAGAEIAKSSAGTYETHLRVWTWYLTENDLDLLSVGLGDLKAYLRHRARLNLSENSIKLDYTSIKNLYKYIRLETEKESQIDLVALNELDPGKFQTRIPATVDPLDLDEVDQLATALQKQRDRIMVLVAVETGARSESLRMLTLDDVDLDEGEIKLKNTKTGGTYTGYISDELALELDRWIHVDREALIPDTDSGYLFPNEDGGMLSGGYLNRIIKSAAEEAGIQEVIAKRKPTLAEKNNGVSADYIQYYRVTTHTLRHTFSYVLEKADAPTEVRSKALNHENIDTTKQHYSYEGVDYENVVRRFVHGNEHNDSDGVGGTN
jgi:integrase/recombinase XerD